MTCIALRRRVEGETERHMRATGRMGVSMPRRIAVVLSAAIEAARKLAGCVLPFGRAPDALTWVLGGEVWNGPGLEG